MPSTCATRVAWWRSPTSPPTRSPRNRLFDADRNAGNPSATSWSLVRSSSSDCASVLPRSRPSSTMIRHRNPGGECVLGTAPKERPHLCCHVAVDRLGIGDSGAETDVGGHHRRSVTGAHRQVLGMGETADVVSDHRASAERRVEHHRVPGVDRDRQVEALDQRLQSPARPARAPARWTPPAPARPSRRRHRGSRRRRPPGRRPCGGTNRSRSTNPGRRTSPGSGSGCPSPPPGR